MNTEKVIKRDQKYIMHTYARSPLVLEHGEGMYAYDADGKAYLDFTSGIGVNALGYCHPAWVQAVTMQATRLQHSSNLYYTAPCGKLAKRLCARTGLDQVFFGNSGAEANEGAIKCARKYSVTTYGPDRNKVLTLVNSFHGRTLATLTATGQDVFHKDFGPFPANFGYIPANDFDTFKAAVDDSVCAVMMEMVQGEGGVNNLSPTFVSAIAKLAKEKDILIAVDEVQTGNGRTWTFTLRQGVLFSDGTEMTANDVVATANHIISCAKDTTLTNKGYYANLRYFVKEIKARDNYTVEVRADRQYYGVLYAMTFPVLPASALESANPPGTGAYMITAFTPYSNGTKGSMTLSLNPYYSGKPPQFKNLYFDLYGKDADVVNAYQYSNVDAIFSRSLSIAQYKSSTNTLAITYRTNQLECLLLNNYLGSMTNNMRTAIRSCINIDSIVQSVYMSMVDRTNTPMIQGTWMYNSNLSSYFQVDLNKARQLLEEDGWYDTDGSGYVDKPNKNNEAADLTYNIITYEEPDNSVRVQAANMIADMLGQIGIKATVETVSYSTMQERLKAGNFHIALVSFAMDVCPDPGFLLMSGNTCNYVAYRSTTMDALFKKLRTQVTQADYQSVLYDIQEQFAKDCPFICLYYRGGTVLTRRMYTTTRDVREWHLLDGIESFYD